VAKTATRHVDRYHGILLVDKPAGITSHDVVDRVRRVTHQRSVGHAGTLDPLATGLLVIALGSATKTMRYLTDQRKTYAADLHLGFVSKTHDAEGVDLSQPSAEIPSVDDNTLAGVLKDFTGVIEQQVPAYSAVRVDGERLYKSARKGDDVTPPTRHVTIDRIEITGRTADHLHLEVTCSKGTYIRSLAHDIGRRLGCGAYLAGLRRLASGRFTIERALTPEALAECADRNELEERLLAIEDALDLGAVHVSPAIARHVCNGRPPLVGDILRVEGDFSAGDAITVKNGNGGILALGTARLSSSAMTGRDSEPVLTFDRVLSGVTNSGAQA